MLRICLFGVTKKLLYIAVSQYSIIDSHGVTCVHIKW